MANLPAMTWRHVGAPQVWDLPRNGHFRIAQAADVRARPATIASSCTSTASIAACQMPMRGAGTRC